MTEHIFGNLRRTLNINSTLTHSSALALSGTKSPTRGTKYPFRASWLCSQHALLPQVVTQVMSGHRWLCCGWESSANRASGPGHEKHDWSSLGRGDRRVVRPSTAVRGGRKTWLAQTQMHTHTHTQRQADGLYVQMHSTKETYCSKYSESQEFLLGFSLVLQWIPVVSKMSDTVFIWSQSLQTIWFAVMNCCFCPRRKRRKTRSEENYINRRCWNHRKVCRSGDKRPHIAGFQQCSTSLCLWQPLMTDPPWHVQDEYVLQSNRKIKLNKNRRQMTN